MFPFDTAVRCARRGRRSSDPTFRSLHLVAMLSCWAMLLATTMLAWAESTTASTAESVTTSTTSLDRDLRALYAESAFPGFAVAIVDRDDGVLYSSGFGWSDRATETPFTAHTVLNIGSVSKTFIGVALMQAAQAGEIDLDAPIDQYLPYSVRNPRHPEQPITLRHLATHTSSIEDRSAIYRQAYTRGEVPDRSLGDYLRRYLDPEGEWYGRKNFSGAAPGAAHEYSNIGAALAAHVLETVVGEPFDAWTRERILEPLGMADSGWSYAAIDRARHATLYDGGEVVEPYTLVTYPDGGLRTSVSSLARYLQAILGGGVLDGQRILSESSVAAMLAGQFDTDDKPKGVGDKNSGIFWTINAAKRIGHTGSDPGVSSVVALDPETGRGYAFVTNTDLGRKTVGSFKAIWQRLRDHP